MQRYYLKREKMFQSMENKTRGYWMSYSEKILSMTSQKHRSDPMDAFLCLNKALLDLYKVKENNGGQKEFNRYAGYVLHFVVLLDTIAMKGMDLDLDYSMDDPNLFDPLEKSVILSVAGALSGVARTFWVQKTVHNRGDPNKYEWESLDYTANLETCRTLNLTLTRVLRYLKSNTDLTLRELAKQHIQIYYGREPTPARGYDIC
jgi:hypothetical protein